MVTQGRQDTVNWYYFKNRETIIEKYRQKQQTLTPEELEKKKNYQRKWAQENRDKKRANAQKSYWEGRTRPPPKMEVEKIPKPPKAPKEPKTPKPRVSKARLPKEYITRESDTDPTIFGMENLKPHQKVALKRIAPQGYFQTPPDENPFVISWK